MAIRPRRVLHRGQLALHCPVIVPSEAPVPAFHWPSCFAGFITGLVISFVAFTSFWLSSVLDLGL
jgi:hypothetical protein